MNKFVILAAAALIGTAGLASAQTNTLANTDAFGIIPVQEDNQLVILPLVTATADGEVQIRRITGENEGEVLGSIPVTAGANENVRITLTKAANASAALAVLVVGGVDEASAEVQLAPVGGGRSSGGGNNNDNGTDN